MNFIWCDIETTGLDAKRDAILALGLVITDARFNEVARAEWVGNAGALALDHMNDFVRVMHTKSGLLDRVQASPLTLRGIEDRACAFLDANLGAPAEKITERPPMAGNSVSFDREFIRDAMPDLITRFNYRLLDVSTLKVLAIATVSEAQAWNDSRPEAPHTPLADLDGSIAELQHWRQELRR